MAHINRERLRAILAERGTNARAVSLAVSSNPTLVRDLLNGKSRNARGDTMIKVAAHLGVAVEELMAGLDASPAPRPAPELTALPLVGRIQAGAWLALDDTPQDEPETRPVALDRRYPHARQWLREVQGDSMNARGVLPGDLAHIVDLTGAGVNLNTGMIVEVTRSRDGGGLREVTLKEVEITPDGVLLWPRSTNPKWKDPVRLESEDGSDVEVAITGLLLAAIRRF